MPQKPCLEREPWLKLSEIVTIIQIQNSRERKKQEELMN